MPGKPGEPGNIREFDSCQTNVREITLSGKTAHSLLKFPANQCLLGCFGLVLPINCPQTESRSGTDVLAAGLTTCAQHRQTHRPWHSICRVGRIYVMLLFI